MPVKILNKSPWEGKLFTGEWVTHTNIRDVMEPATLKTMTQTAIASANDINKACHNARIAQKKWGNISPDERSVLFLNAAGYLEKHMDELALIIARETGGILAKGLFELQIAISILRLSANLAVQPNGLVLASSPDRESIAKRIPLGVVGVISPFNFPLILSIRSVAPALALGNAVVSKPDPQTPLSGGYILAMAFEFAGFPKGVYQVCPGDKDAGEALCSAKEVAMIAFTGSTSAGRSVGEICGRNLKKVILELGGKNSLIILDDANLDQAVNNIAWGSYMHQGQICMTSGRILVHESVAERLTEKLIKKANELKVGDPATEQVALGPLINDRQLQRVHNIVLESIESGAKLVAGGTYEKLFYRPTVLTDVEPGMKAFDEEIFGPVASITTFKTDEEAIQLASLTEYGLSAAIISPDLARARRLGNQLDVGLLHINDQTVNDEGVNPFGGTGASGNGQSVGGPNNIDLYTHWKWITEKDTPIQFPF
ncbi:MAG: Benzaldehyde dehydrogenase [NAD(+)] [Candidatus Celerinatantimonas neptuna]|nr:MAG: Benzaldehyde dehydrogenase [NAD(+)] [Candidatus Celerinatantimonas neptuna]